MADAYGGDFYRGYPCLTVNRYGKGKAWYVACDGEKEFYEEFIGRVLEDSHISGPVKEEIPRGLEITTRETDAVRYNIYQNFGEDSVIPPLPGEGFECVFGSEREALPPLGFLVLKSAKE